MPYPQKRCACDRAYVAARGQGYGPQLLLFLCGIFSGILASPMVGCVDNPDGDDDGNVDDDVFGSEGSPELCGRTDLACESSEEAAVSQPPSVVADVSCSRDVFGCSSSNALGCLASLRSGCLVASDVSRQLVRSESVPQSFLCDMGIQPHRLPPFVPRCLGGVPRIIISLCALGRHVGLGALPFGLFVIEPKTSRRSLGHPGTASSCSPAAAHAHARARARAI